MKKLFFMKKMWVAILASILFSLCNYATQIPIPSAPADSLEHFLEQYTDLWATGDTVVLVDSNYVVNGTMDLYQGLVIIGDPALGVRPEVQLNDQGFKFKQDSIGLTIKGINFTGNGKTTGYLVRDDQLSVNDSIFTSIIIEDCNVSGIKGGLQLHKNKYAVYDSVIVDNCIWSNFYGDYAIDPRICFTKKIVITNSTFYDLAKGFLKNPGFAEDKNGYAIVPKEIIIDHNTFYNIGGGNNSLIQINDPTDSTVTFTFTNNIVQKLYDPTNVRPFRINESAGTFDFDYNVIYDFMPTNPDKMQYSLDSTAANQTNVTVTNLITDDPKLLDKNDFRLPLNSPLFTADSKGGQIGDPRWTEFEGVHIFEPEEKVFTNSPVQLEAAIILASGDTVLNWTVETFYGATRGMATVVDSTGLLTPTVAGQVKVTATSVENGAFFDTLIVTIQDSVHVTAIEVHAETTTIVEKDGDLDIIASITPKNATDPRILWSVSDEKIATIQETNDTITELVAKSNGVVWVKAKSMDSGLEDSLDITVAIHGLLSDDATLSDLQVDGTTVEGFASDKTDYAVELPVGTTAVPAVTATTTHPNASEVVTAATTLPGTTTIEVTAEDGTTKKSYKIDFTVKTTGIEENLKNQIKVFPNPANDFITLNITQQSIVSIHNIVGDMVMNQVLEVDGSIDISGLINGIYVVNAVSGDEVITLRFVKE